MKLRYFLDTEFVEDAFGIMPLSLALLCEDGRSLVVEFEYDERRAKGNDFVRENVLPHLKGTDKASLKTARWKIMTFLGLPVPKTASKGLIEIWAFYAATDWVLFYNIWGTLLDLPWGIPGHCMDLQQWWVQLGRPKDVKPPKPKDAHDALVDAKWNMRFYKALEEYANPLKPSIPRA